MEQGYRSTAIGSPLTPFGIQRMDENPTVEENINRKIAYHQKEIERLEQSKLDLGPLLKMRIQDIRQAMDY